MRNNKSELLPLSMFKPKTYTYLVTGTYELQNRNGVKYHRVRIYDNNAKMVADSHEIEGDNKELTTMQLIAACIEIPAKYKTPANLENLYSMFHEMMRDVFLGYSLHRKA